MGPVARIRRGRAAGGVDGAQGVDGGVRAQIGDDGRGVGPVAPAHDDVDAGGPDQGVHGAGAVGGGVVEDVEVDLAAPAAPRREPFAVQRRQTRERREADPQPRMTGTAEGPEREPRAVQLLLVGDQSRPPGRDPGSGEGRARMDEQRSVEACQHVEQRSARAPADIVQQRCGRELQSHAALPECLLHRGGVRRAQTGGGPDAERCGQRQSARVEGVEQGKGLGRPQVLDAQRAGQRHQGDVETVGDGQPHTGLDVVVTGVHRERRLALQVQRPAVETWRSGARPEQLDEGGRPDVLVDVDGHPEVLGGPCGVAGTAIGHRLSASVMRLT